LKLPKCIDVAFLSGWEEIFLGKSIAVGHDDSFDRQGKDVDFDKLKEESIRAAEIIRGAFNLGSKKPGLLSGVNSG
jgi:hypothetical protein